MATDTTIKGPAISMHVPDKIAAFKHAGGIDLTAHIFYPKNREQSIPLPVFVFFHPGGWSMGEPLWGYDLCHHYSMLGMVAISFQYRLSSINGFSPVDALGDVRSAIRWTRKEAKKYNIDPKKVIAGAISAGAHLAACAAIIGGYDDPADDTRISPVPNALALQSACLNPTIFDEFTSLLQGRDKPENLSPFHHIKPGLPPMCLIHGTADDLVPFESVKEFSETMIKAGNRCDLHPFEGTDHFFSQKEAGAKAVLLVDSFIKSLGYIS